MNSEFRGKVLIHSIPSLEAAQQIYNMLRAVHPEAKKEVLPGLSWVAA